MKDEITEKELLFAMGGGLLFVLTVLITSLVLVWASPKDNSIGIGKYEPEFHWIWIP
jgi:hypothetical protein